MPISETAPPLFAQRMRAEFGCVAPLLSELQAWMAQSAASSEMCETVQIALAEALNNVVEHGGLRPQQGIEVLARTTASGLRIAVIDRGQPYPGGEMPDGHQPDIRDLPEGGFGWMMIHTLTQGLSYRRNAGTNILTLYFERQ